MRAAILLRVNPGYQDKSYETIKSFFTQSELVQGAEVETIDRYLGMWDGIVTCRCVDEESLNMLAEILKQDGVFHTEILISIE
jgi:DNA-binding Lrp family transcriptional regulator